MRALAIIAAALLAACLSSNAAENAVERRFPIAGTIIDSQSGRPVRNALVQVERADTVQGQTGSTASVRTDGEGRFRFEVVQGKWRLLLMRMGLPPQNYGTKTAGSGFGIAIVTGADQDTSNLVFRVYPLGAITGKVTDESGDPVENALVQLVYMRTVSGKRSGTSGGFAYTNDLGEYRFGSLVVGTYFLAVTGKPWFAEEGQSQTAYASVFYPNARDARSAAPIVLKTGEEARAEFMLASTRGYQVRVQCGESTAVPEQKRVQIVSEGVEGLKLFDRVETMYGSQIAIASVPPGRYTARLMDPKGRLLATQPIEVGSADLEVKIEHVDPVTIRGVVALEADAPQVQPGKVRIALHREADAYSTLMDPTQADGTVKIEGLMPGRYRAHAFGERGVFATDVSIGGKRLHDTEFEVPPTGLENWTVYVSTKSGRVKGYVRRAGKSEAGVLVVLAPANETLDHVHYHGFMTDSDGSFDFEGVYPGDYRLFATTDAEFEWGSPMVVKPYLERATRVRIMPGETTEQTLDAP